MHQGGVWADADIARMAATPKALAEARSLAAKGVFGVIDRSADGRTWAAPCRGTQGTYRVTVYHDPRAAETGSTCTCRSPQFPCKHALALMLAVNADPALSDPAAAPDRGGDFESLLRAVFQQPADDTPRLVFADYLDDRGDADRAAFIRLQCRIARLTPRDRGKRELRKQEADAITRLGHLTGPLGPLATQGPVPPRYERGFLHLTLWFWSGAADLPAGVDQLLRDGWVAALEVTGQGRFTATVMEALGRAGALDFRPTTVDESALLALASTTASGAARVAAVRLRPADQRLYDRLRAATAPDGPAATGGRGDRASRTYQGVTAAEVRTLVRAGRLDGVRDLALHGPIGDDGAAALAETPTAGSLRTLELHGTRIGAAGGAALAASPYLAGVASVHLFGPAMDDGFAALCAGGGLPGLREFRAEGGRIGDGAAAAVSRATQFTRLEKLVWESTDLTPTGAAAILGSPHLPALSDVTFNGNPFTPESYLTLTVEAADRLTVKLSFPGAEVRRQTSAEGVELTVESLSLRSLRDTTQLLDGLIRCPAAGRISALTLAGVWVSPDTLRLLAKALDPARVQSLTFSGCHLGNTGVSALVVAFAAFRPTRLSLTSDNVRRSGAEALAAAPLMAGVRELDLSGNQLAPAGVAAFAAHGATLKTFTVRDTGLTAADRRRLKKQLPGLAG